MQLVHRSLRIGKRFGIPREFAIVRIPAVRTEVCAEIDHRFAGEILVPKLFCFRNNLFGRTECPMRLLVAKGPQRHHLRVSGNLGVLTQNRHRLASSDDEHIQRQRPLRVSWLEHAFSPGQVERAKWFMYKDRPAGSSDKKLDRYLAPMRS